MPKTDNTLPFGRLTLLATYISFVTIVVVGHIRDQIGKIFRPWQYRIFAYQNGMPPLFTSLDSFFIRRIYQRISDCWNRPIHGVPGRKLEILERISIDNNKSFEFTNERIRALNTGSYNYLGNAENKGETIDLVLESVDKYDINFAYPTVDYEQNPITRDLEKEIAKFFYKEDAIVYSMGYGTNTCAIHCLMKDSLILSDEYNHASLIKGIQLSKSKVIVFRHNDMKDLEKKLEFNITQGVPETHRPWKKIFVIVEGLYSMEGSIVNLRKIIELKEKYKFYIFMDEAHSVGAMGKTGRGICEHLGVSHSDVDLLMGTFSKSFGGFGGYIAANKDIINFLKTDSDFSLYGEQMAPIVTIQILSCLRKIIADNSLITKLHRNTRIARDALKSLGFYMLGDRDSPIIPILIPVPGKIGEFSRLCLERGLAVVVVGYPATPILLNRVRLCMSASHSTQDLDFMIKVVDQVGSLLGMKK